MTPETFAGEYKSKLLHTLETLDLKTVAQAIEILREAREQNRQIFVCGNGGSASTASHFVCDMVKGASFQRQKRFRIMALADCTPTLTAYSNDVGYDCVFTEQLKNFAQQGDVVIALSGSGNSPNVVNALEYANSISCQTIALTGRDGGQLGSRATLQIHVAEPHMGRIEDGHLIVCHMLCYHFMENDAG
jgi:D-sedoheptulose 7-phosphate isomerase